MVAPGSTNRQHKLRPGGFCGTMYDSTSSPATLLLSNMARGALGLPPLLRHLYQLSKKSVLERQQPVWSAVSSSWNPGWITGLHHHCKLLNSLLLNKLEWVQGYILILIVLPSSPHDQREKGKGTTISWNCSTLSFSYRPSASNAPWLCLSLHTLKVFFTHLLGCVDLKTHSVCP